ncbi:phosphatidylinositol-specific phospholipase [Echria macrotheca]|uniref:Phosphatidylinositol-specific phospholipase n=1 Tax=Echria macrotheca TaxID=438768 RepID=A0AAJ0BFE8_9PEZI|nr:phosphatidylinositol-specific phospholipase [Echria macrotheca]
MSWIPHGASNSGLVQANKLGQSRTVPAVATYRGRIWCLWADLEGNSWYSVTGDEDGEFGPRIAFPQPGLPVLSNLNGHLHAIIALDSGHMVHFLYDEEDQQAWVCLGPVPDAITHSSPCLVAFHNKLFLSYRKAGELYYAIWINSTSSPNSASNPAGTWSSPIKVTPDVNNFDGIPAIFVLRGTLHLLCGVSSEAHDIMCYRFDYISSTWSSCDDISEGRAARGVSATSYGDKAFLGFIENGPEDETHAICVAPFTNDKWQPHETISGQTAADPPQLTVLNGRIHCIFNENTPTKDLRWYSRPLLSYSLSSWMSTIPSSTPISALTIPGTHDSCARSNIPFVRTQYLSIPQQLRLGIRFLDLRLRIHAGSLYCYHGGIPLDLPRRLSLDSVLTSIWTFLRGPSLSDTATETILVSINNDDPSSDPSAFYQAVSAAISSTPPYPDGTSRWYTSPSTPTLSTARGKAILLRRYPSDPTIPPQHRQGLDLSPWVANSPLFTITTPLGTKVLLQDKWKFSDRIALADLIASKSSFVRELMLRAVSSSDSSEWYINFCSAVGDPVEHGEVAEAKWIAVGAHSDWIGKWVSGMNSVTREFLVEALPGLVSQDDDGQQKARLGIVNLDYPELPEDNDVVARLIEMNF